MEQKRKPFTLNRYSIGASALLILLAAASSIVFTAHNRTNAAAVTKPPVGASVPSKFSFTGATGWWQGATNKTSMALFHRTDGCFTSVEYKSGAIDTAAELQKTQSMLTSEGYVVTPGSVQTLTLQTNRGLSSTLCTSPA